MVLWWLIPVLFFSAGLITIIVIFVRKIPQLRVIDISSSPTDRNKRVKDQILMQRIERTQKAKLQGVARAFGAVGTKVSKIGRRTVQKVHAWEQYYEKLKKTPDEAEELDPAVVQKLLDEADVLVKAEEYIPAEKKYIEVISHHPRNIKAYQGLVDLYMADKQFDQAKETLLFVLRLAPENANVHSQMSELEAILGRPKHAFEEAKRALELEPKHPKIIDLFIESAFLIGDKKEASRGIKLLEKVNPENQKLESWKERLKV